MSEYLFTYGTLRSNENQPMVNFLKENSILKGMGVLSNAILYLVDWYPAMIKSNNEKDVVIGDVLQLKNKDAWLTLDEYEGIGVGEPPYEYRREKIKATVKGEIIECWAYFYNLPLTDEAKQIESGDFLNP